MTQAEVSYPLLLEPYRSAKNGLYPEAEFYAHAVGALNHIHAYRGSVVFQRSNLLGFTRASGSNVIWRFRFRSGYGQTHLQFMGILGLSSTSAANPSITITVVKSGGGTQSISVYGGTTGTTVSDAPSEWSPFEHTFDIDPASVYECSVTSVDYGAILALTARQLGDAEIDDSVNYQSEWEPGGTLPIYDVNQQQLIEGSGRLVRRNRGLLTTWCLYNGAARTNSTTTWTNLIDNTSTSPPTSTSPGYRFNTTALNTASRTIVPIEVAVYATATGSGDGHVTLRDTSGTDVAALDIISGLSARWFTSDASAYIDVGTGEKLDIGFYAEASTTVNVYAVCIVGYEA